MPAPWHPVPAHLSPLHLYRHVLRELSYLPPSFRTTIASLIRAQFHKNRQHDSRAKTHLSRARSALRTLRAANSGDKKAMEGFMARGFARVGKRRRELLAQLVKPQGPNDTQALEAFLDETVASDQAHSTASEASSEPAPRAPKRPKNDFFQRWDQPKLLQILQSQRNQRGDTKGTTSWPGGEVRRLNQDQFVPERNIWGKPPATCVVRAKRARWWRLNADKIMPPLGKGEWELLGRLSNGAQEKEEEWAVPERRPTVKPLIAQGGAFPCQPDWEAYATKPAAVVEKQKSPFLQKRSGQRDTGPHAGRERNTALSPRWFRRAYSRTWQLAPTMIQNPNTLQYSFRWGKARLTLPPATKAQLEVFEGVDQRGCKLAAASRSH